MQDAADVALPASGRRLVHGRLDVEFSVDSAGRTYLDRQYANHPFHICRPHYHDNDLPGLATLYAQSCSGGLYEDDRLDIRIVARAGAEAHVTTQAATVVHSMPSGSALQNVRIEVERGAFLEYLPDPQILFPNSRCTSTMNVRVTEGAAVLISDAFLKHDPDGGEGVFASYFSEIVIGNDAGKTLSIDRLKLDGQSLIARHPGITGAFAAQGTLVVASFDTLPQAVLAEIRKIRFDYGEAAIGVSQLPKSAGLIVRVLAIDGAAVKRAMHASWCAARLVLKGALPVERRK